MQQGTLQQAWQEEMQQKDIPDVAWSPGAVGLLPKPCVVRAAAVAATEAVPAVAAVGEAASTAVVAAEAA